MLQPLHENTKSVSQISFVLLKPSLVLKFCCYLSSEYLPPKILSGTHGVYFQALAHQTEDENICHKKIRKLLVQG